MVKKKPHSKNHKNYLLYISIAVGATISSIILYLTKGQYYLTTHLKTASLTGYETLPVSIAKWELGVVIFIIGALVYNYNQNTLNRKKNMEFSWVLVGLMTQGAILAIGAY